MKHRLSADQVFYAFSASTPPALFMQPGEEVSLQTLDCFSGQLTSPDDQVAALNWEKVNPATGPVFVEGSHPGDILKLEICALEVANSAVMVTIPGEGALGTMIETTETCILQRTRDQLVFKDRISLPIKPMIGVLGVAPAEGSIGNGTPDAHGGNMDCTLIGKGASVYFTVNVAGALFGAGDFHSLMGDGEVVVCGAECAGEVTLRPTLENHLRGLPTPMIVTDDLAVCVFSAPNLDAATAGAIQHMQVFLTKFVGIPPNDAALLMSLVGQLKFCQVVDPNKTVRFEFPLEILQQYGFQF